LFFFDAVASRRFGFREGRESEIQIDAYPFGGEGFFLFFVFFFMLLVFCGGWSGGNYAENLEEAHLGLGIAAAGGSHESKGESFSCSQDYRMDGGVGEIHGLV